MKTSPRCSTRSDRRQSGQVGTADLERVDARVEDELALTRRAPHGAIRSRGDDPSRRSVLPSLGSRPILRGTSVRAGALTAAGPSSRPPGMRSVTLAAAARISRTVFGGVGHLDDHVAEALAGALDEHRVAADADRPEGPAVEPVVDADPPDTRAVAAPWRKPIFTCALARGSWSIRTDRGERETQTALQWPGSCAIHSVRTTTQIALHDALGPDRRPPVGLRRRPAHAQAARSFVQLSPRVSGRTRTPATEVMKFVSPIHRGHDVDMQMGGYPGSGRSPEVRAQVHDPRAGRRPSPPPRRRERLARARPPRRARALPGRGRA